MNKTMPIFDAPTLRHEESDDDHAASRDGEVSATPACTLFVGDLGRHIGRDEINNLFSQYGAVLDIRLKHAKITKHPLGYGFVEMADIESAALCVENLNGYLLNGKQITVRWASRNKKLFFTNLGRNTTLNDILTLCQNYGSICPEKSAMNYAESGNSYAIVEFDERESAEAAKIALNGSTVRLHDQEITLFVNWEQSVTNRTRANPSVVSPQNSPFPYFSIHISFRCSKQNIRVSEKMIYNAYKEYGSMTTVTIKNVFIDPNTQTQSGFGFIHFETIEGARAAVYQGSTLHIGGVTYTAEFSKHLLKRGEKKYEPSSSASSEIRAPVPIAAAPSHHPHSHHHHHHNHHPPPASAPAPAPAPAPSPNLNPTPMIWTGVPQSYAPTGHAAPMPSYSPGVYSVYPTGYAYYPHPHSPGSFSSSYQMPYTQLPWQDSYGYPGPYPAYYSSSL